MGGEGGEGSAPTYGELAVAVGELCQQVIQLEAERDAAQGQAARLAHVLAAVDRWAGTRPSSQLDDYDDARADLRAVLATARDERWTELEPDPYGTAAALARAPRPTPQEDP